MKCEETNQHDLIRYGFALSELCQGLFAKTEHFLVRMFRNHSSVFDGYTNVLLCFFFFAVAPFYLHITVFTKEHVKHANKGELIYR